MHVTQVELARQRSEVYGLLAGFYRREPDHALAEQLRCSAVFDNLTEAGMDLDPEELLAPPSDELVEILVADYTALFLTPGDRLLLNESVHRADDGSLMGASTAEVMGLIRSLGLKIDAHWPDLPDHLSIEFELMQRLAATEADLLDAGDADSLARCRGRQRAFLVEHLGSWVPDVCAIIESRASTVFYSELARLTRAFIREEMRALV